MSFFMSDAIAAVGSAPAAPTDGTFSLIMVGAIFILFYFMLIRPQNKRAKEHRQLVSQIQKGDEVITSGGMLAKVASVDEQYIKVLIAEGVEICLQRNSVTSVLPKGTCKSL
ncbi:MAG: preprotein translocase subunit YajC [Legionellales bacterium]|nr:preprotein translocase subunit YajC [Legionellales bacterium]